MSGRAATPPTHFVSVVAGCCLPPVAFFSALPDFVFFRSFLSAAFWAVSLSIARSTARSTEFVVTPLCMAFFTAFSIALTAFFPAFFFAIVIFLESLEGISPSVVIVARGSHSSCWLRLPGRDAAPSPQIRSAQPTRMVRRRPHTRPGCGGPGRGGGGGPQGARDGRGL